MNILRVRVIKADTCGGLLDGFEARIREPEHAQGFDPLCMIGPNGSGKSQLLQLIAEIFQSLAARISPTEEREDGNPTLQFDIEYLVRGDDGQMIHVRAVREAVARGGVRGRKLVLTLQRRRGNEWDEIDLDTPAAKEVMPRLVVGYTSGENETLSRPFFRSRGFYAAEVADQALGKTVDSEPVAETRLMFIDYGTNLEVLVANLLLGAAEQRAQLVADARVADLHSFRCVVQIAHSAAPTLGGVRGVRLTSELRGYVENLKRCATCYEYDDADQIYTFDFWVNEATRRAFRAFWPSGALQLYRSIHKLAMLNDLVISRRARKRFERDARNRRFTARLPEPEDEEKVFRFERVNFVPSVGRDPVDYVSLSDGEHQFIEILGVFAMMSEHNVLFLLDEPESHLNPRWRVQFLSRLMALPTSNGPRASGSLYQDCWLTTHAPFVPSDMRMERVFIFRKEDQDVTVRLPDLQTYGSTFDSILDECFGVAPPISNKSNAEIEALLASSDVEMVRAGLARLGHSAEKSFLADHFRELTSRDSGD